ncbi:MAG: protein kinase domain-containing protein [Gemmatimonadales bacterium]
MSAVPPSLAQALRSRYTLVRELGRGGMATVYLARDLKHDRPVALKVLRPEVAAELGVQRFLREIKVAAQLHHPHILPLYDSGTVAASEATRKAPACPYYVMPYVEGESLRERLGRKEKVPLADALRLAREIAEALDYAHRQNIVHRDIKPENVLLEDGHAVVTDFGIARAMIAAGERGLTGVGLTVGTPAYMSPEQAMGEGELDGRSDVYSLGCVLFELLTGEPPFTAQSSIALMVQRWSEPAPRVRTLRADVPDAVDEAVHRALAQAPEDRFLTAAAFAEALAAASAGITSGPYTHVAGRTRLPAEELSIAVLPFANLSADKETEYFTDGMTEEIINALSQVPGLRVVARTSAFAFKGKDMDVRDIGGRLNVRALVEGSVRKAGDRIRITAQLVNTADGYHLWSQTYDRTLADVFAVQDELARSIAGALQRKVGRGESGSLVGRPTDDLAAYTVYLKGQYAWNKRTHEGYRTAIEEFERAAALDPQFALPHAGIAYCQAMLGFDEVGVVPPLEAMPKALAAAEQALELDPLLPQAHGARAVVAFLYEWDWALADNEFARAASLGPDVTGVSNWHAIFLSLMGRDTEAMEIITRAQAIDPLSLINQLTMGRCHYLARRFDEAIALFRSCLDLEPRFFLTYSAIARVYLAKGMFPEALAELEQGMSLVGRLPLFLTYAGLAHAKLGQRSEALGVLDDLRQAAAHRYVPTIYRAQILSALGDLDEAFELYDAAYRQRSGWLVFLRAEPLWDHLRPDPRFRELLRKMRLDS